MTHISFLVIFILKFIRGYEFPIGIDIKIAYFTARSTALIDRMYFN